MKTLKYPILLLLLTLAIPFLFLSVSAESESLVINLSPSLPALTDGRENASVSVTEVTLTAESEMQGIYILYYDTPTDFTVKSGEESAEVKGLYLRRFFSLSEVFGEGKKEVTLTFASSVRILEIYAFSDETPSWVQKWEEPCEKADLCLMTTHADDEQLFFAGVLPYYAGEKDFAVQVVYFTDHKNEPLRRHELLNGLWTVGVENYPVISPFPDLYSESESTAQSQFQNYGFSREDVVAFQVEMLRRFRPLVVIGHDPEGEYGHGQHRLNSATLQEAVTVSGDATAFPESAETYGTWEVPKTYLHLYGENEIVMDWDVPLSSFEGKTAFQVTQEGFLCHTSQQYTWFRRWLNGNNGEITKASQITTHSPCKYGLFLSRVGEDVLKNDFFENLKTWEQQRLEEEARLRAEEEAKRKAEEERLAAEEAARQKAEEEARLAAEEKRLAEKLAEENRLAEEIRTKREKILILMGGVFLLLCVFGAMIFYNMKKKD